ncbi:MAG: DinB family protein [Bacteroidota bacterium]|nr:DinB family protein [Bacteroidota bacterium]
MQPEKSENAALVNHLTDLLNKGNAHVTLDESVNNIPFEIVDKKPHNLPYNLWQIVEHIRIAQWDILEFSKDANHKSPKWPDGYWPENTKPSKEEWGKCIQQIKKDRQAFISLLKESSESLFTPFDYGNGQTLLREALVLADHNSYHTGEIILLRRLLNNWKK